MSNNKKVFGIKYSGKALVNHEININDLANALFSFSSIIVESNNVLNQGNAKIDLNVKTFKPGSFGVDIELIQGVIGFVGTVSPIIIPIYDILESVGFVGNNGLIGLIKKIKGRHISDINIKGDGNVTYVLGDNSIINIDNSTHQLYSNTGIRKDIERLKEPIDKDGIDTFSCYYDDYEEEKITKNDKDLFVYSDNEEKEEILEDEAILKLIGPVFEEGNKWQFRILEKKIFVSINDETFLSDVNNKIETFSKGDSLRVILITIKKNGKHSYSIKKVIEHIKGFKQMQIKDKTDYF